MASFSLLSLISFAQDTTFKKPETIVKKQSPPTPEKYDEEEYMRKERNTALTATLLSAAIPGAGQVYNKKIWKVPIIYGLGGYLVWNINDKNQDYQTYQQSLVHLQEKADLGYSNTPYLLGDDTTSIITTVREEKNELRKKRDRSIIYLILVYGLNIVDANVDAHLKGFEVSPGMIMTLRTDIIDDKKLLVGFNLTF